MSHELRTPLAAIKGSSTSAPRTTRMLEPAEAGQFFRIIDEQADRMDRLVSDLLDAGRIDAGTLSLQPRAAEVAVLVDQARNMLRNPQDRERRIQRKLNTESAGT